MNDARGPIPTISITATGVEMTLSPLASGRPGSAELAAFVAAFVVGPPESGIALGVCDRDEQETATARTTPSPPSAATIHQPFMCGT